MKYHLSLAVPFLGTIMGLIAAQAAERSPLSLNCYQFEMNQSPSARPIRLESAKSERWCYYRFAQNAKKYVMAFNADQDQIKAELAAIVEKDSAGKTLDVVHGSLNQGDVTIHRIGTSGINPLPVPLDEKPAQPGIQAVSAKITASQTTSLNAVADQLLSAQSSQNQFQFKIKEGHFETTLPQTQWPWRGWWWPDKDYPLGNGDGSPLGKYDRLVKAWSGRNPQSTVWEGQNHSLANLEWGGHCNGWVAASVLYKEPTQTWHSSEINDDFRVSDFKGILTEASYCVELAFYGRRYDTHPGEKLTDISPDLFHAVLTYYLEEAKKPIAYDYVWSPRVDNNVITGYTSDISLESPGKYRVKTAVLSHAYDLKRNEKTGVSSPFWRKYEYYLYTDASGKITQGEWLGDQPDFLWVPLAPAARCAYRNPQLDLSNVSRILENAGVRLE